MKEKKMKTKLLTILALGLAFIGVVNAQTFTGPETKTSYATAKTTQLVGTLNSGTTPSPITVSPYESVFVYCSGTAITSQSLNYQNDNGQTISATTVACGTTASQVASHAAGTFGFTQLTISPTAGLSAANTVTNYVQKQPVMLPKSF